MAAFDRLCWAVVLLAACGDDDDTTGAGAAGGGTVSSSSSAATVSATTSASSTGAGGGAACAGPDVLGPLTAFVGGFEFGTSQLAGHGGALEAIGFLLSPGLPEPPGVAAIFAGPLIEACSRPMSLAPYCLGSQCQQLECTGIGAGWVHHIWLGDTPFSAQGFTFQSVTVDVAWVDGTVGATFVIAAEATDSSGRVWDMSGEGTLDPEQETIDVTFPALLESSTDLTFTTSPTESTGTITSANVVIATLVDHAFVATGDCP